MPPQQAISTTVMMSIITKKYNNNVFDGYNHRKDKKLARLQGAKE
ncbi:MAG: hypothetical protein ACJAT7_001276 [Psychromonas sp.]|jgi:hypothetical protein